MYSILTMSLSNQISTRLFQSFIVELAKDLILVSMKIDPKNNVKNIIHNGHLINYNLLKPKKIINKKIYQELLVIYSLCWMRKKAEEIISEESDMINVSLQGSILFCAYIMGSNANLDIEEYSLYSNKVSKILEKYENTNIYRLMLVTAEEQMINPSENGFAVLQLLHHHMKFELFS